MVEGAALRLPPPILLVFNVGPFLVQGPHRERG